MKRTFELTFTVEVDFNEVPSDDAIDHAQTTLREFEDDTPDIPGTTAYTPPRTAREGGPRITHISDLHAQAEKRRFRHICGSCGMRGYNRRSCTYPTPIRDIPGALHRPDSPRFHP